MVSVNRGISPRLAGVAVLLFVAGCASVQQPHRDNLAAEDPQLNACAHWFKSLDAAVTRAGVNDIAARPVEGFPYLRVDRFTAAIGQSAAADPVVLDAWIGRMQALGADGHRVEIANLPAPAIQKLGVGDKNAALSRSRECSLRMVVADFSDQEKARALLEQRAHVDDDYSSLKRTLGLYALTRVPFNGGIQDWHDEAVETFEQARNGKTPAHPVTRYVPSEIETYTREQIAALLRRSADPTGVPVLSAVERERLFATYAPILEIETTGDYDRIGKLFWSTSPAPDVDISRPTVYRKLAFTRVDGHTLVQLVYVAWMKERPKDGAFDLLGGKLDGIVWRVTLAPDGEPLAYDTIHPCGCFHMFFPTPRAEPLPAPKKYVEWAFVPATLPTIDEGTRITVSVQTRTHYLSNVWPHQEGNGVEYVFADYDTLRTLPLPTGGSRSAFAPDGLVPGTQRGERYFFWPMGIDSAGAMRQWGTHATAFLGRRHFDDADLLEERFRFTY